VAKLEQMSFDGLPARVDHDGHPQPMVGGWRRRFALVGAVATALVLVLALVVVLRPHRPSRAAADRAPSTVKPSTAAPAAPSTTGSTASTAVNVTTTGKPVTVPGAPGRLVLTTPALDFGATGVLRQIRLSNPGDQPVLWSATAVVDWVSVAPASGAIAGGDEVLVAVSLDRDRAPEGSLATTISVTGPGGSVGVAVTGTVDRPPRITGDAIDATAVYPQGSACQPQVATVTATVTDGSGVASVVLGWRTPDRQEHTTVMSSSGGGVWQGRLGPFSASGSIGWWIVATDAGGNRARNTERVLPVLDCVPS
jgi:hypothetical protein